MNIKYLANVRIPTTRTHGYAIMKMCSELSKHCESVELVVPDRKDSDNIDKDPFVFYKVEKNFKISKITSLDLLGGTMNFGKVFYWLDTVSFIGSILFKNIIKGDDVVYTRDFLSLLAVSSRNFICLEIHSIPSSKFLFKKALRKSRLLFVLNKNLKDELVALGVSKEKMFIFPSGVEISDFDIDVSQKEAREKTKLPQDKKIVVYTGHLYDWKGVDTLARTSSILKDTIFVFIGGVEPEISKFKAQYNNQNIIVLPFQDREFIPFYLKSADVLVLPNSGDTSISSKYTSPLKLFEYMASERPIVASDLPSLREVLNEENCVFANPDDPSSFATAIERVLSDDSLALAISTEAKSDVSAYAWSDRARKIIDIINTKI